MKTQENLKTYWRKLDNVAKVFSLDAKSNTNIFRYSVVLKEKVNENILKKALIKALENCQSFKVKIGTGFFWNYLEFNTKEPLVTIEDDIPCPNINVRNNNDYLFKITYYKKKINLDVIHSLTDGVGASMFLKSIVYNYLNMKHKISTDEMLTTKLTYKDKYLKYYDKNLISKTKKKKAFQIPGKIKNQNNNTYHYTIDLENIKKICKERNVTITEYLTAIYIYAMYLSFHKNKSKKEIAITIPIDLRKYYQTESLTNFFVCANIIPKIIKEKLSTFDELLKAVKKEFKEKINVDKIKSYLTRDVKLGTNIGIRLVPLFVKKTFMNFIIGIAKKESTSTLSNVGIIDIDSKYKEYIDNILVLVRPNRNEKIKCTICSYDKKLNITINSIVDDADFEKTFFKLLQNQITNIKLETNLIK